MQLNRQIESIELNIYHRVHLLTMPSWRGKVAGEGRGGGGGVSSSL